MQETRRIEAVVVALVSEYHQVKIRDSEGNFYALTRATPGVDLAKLYVGQRIVCTVTCKLARVVAVHQDAVEGTWHPQRKARGNMKLWTVWLDYSATGEGRSLAARVAYAENEQAALSGFEGVFGDFLTRCAYAAEGVVDNGVTRALFAAETFKRVAELEGRATVDLIAQYHFNFS